MCSLLTVVLVEMLISSTAGSTVASQKHLWMSPHGYPEVCGDSSSSAAFSRASEWLSHCVENDQACAQHSSDFVPRRLVNVNLGNETQDPFLVEPIEPMKYACLSYCWGPDAHDVLRTTKDNIEDHRSRIPINSMPASVRDAVKLCRGLNIPYLWVDSLCILQGHRDEWLHDSSKMDLTYLNSHLTIAALEPASCKSGFLGKQLYSRQEERPNFEAYDEYHPFPEPHHSLNGRGWCMQEEIMPNRRLCFNGSEMRWECLCRTICECGHEVWPDKYGKYDISQLSALLKMRSMTVLPPRIESIQDQLQFITSRRLNWLGADSETNQQRDDFDKYSSSMTRTHELWRDLISNYSKRTLSYRTDRLAALAGITKMTLNALRQENDFPEEFLAGLWTKEIYFDLAWYTDRPEAPLHSLDRQSTSEEAYCAPSWSWASSDMPIKYTFSKALWSWSATPTVTDTCKLMAAKCITELAGDSTGPVLAGRIRIKGSIVPVELGMLEKPKGKVLVRTENLKTVKVILDDPISPNIKLDDRNGSCWLEGKCEKGCCLWDKNKQTRFYCFRLFSWYDGPLGTVKKKTWFLLLEKRSEGDFQRIGIGKQRFWLSPIWENVNEESRYAGWLFEDAKEETIEII